MENSSREFWCYLITKYVFHFRYVCSVLLMFAHVFVFTFRMWYQDQPPSLCSSAHILSGCYPRFVIKQIMLTILISTSRFQLSSTPTRFHPLKKWNGMYPNNDSEHDVKISQRRCQTLEGNSKWRHFSYRHNDDTATAAAAEPHQGFPSSKIFFSSRSPGQSYLWNPVQDCQRKIWFVGKLNWFALQQCSGWPGLNPKHNHSTKTVTAARECWSSLI